MIHSNFILTFVIWAAVLLSTNTFAENTAQTISLNEAQLASVNKLLKSNKGMIDDKLLNLFVDSMYKNAKEQLKLPTSYWAWLDSHKAIKQGLISARYPMDHASIKRLAQFYGGIDKPLVEKYQHLLLGVCLKQEINKGKIKSKKQVADINADVDSVIAYMKKSNKSLIDIASDVPALLKAVKLNTPEKLIARDLLDSIALKTGVYPAVNKVSRLESLKFIINNQEKKIEVKVAEGFSKKAAIAKFKNDYSWPMFPIETSAWIVLIDLGEKFDLKVAGAIWDRFLKGEGIIRYKGYGGKWKKPEYRFRKSEWNPLSLCRIIEDGGICGRQATLARTSNKFFGIPSTRMPQPGHAAVASFGYDKTQNKFYSYRLQSLKPFKETDVHWSFGEMPPGIRVKGKGGVIVGIEYQMGLALAANKSLDGYVKSRLALHLSRALKGLSNEMIVQTLEKALNNNPYNTEVVYSLTEAYGANLQKVNGLIGKLRQLASSTGKIDFEVVRGADTDFEKIKPVKVEKSDKVKSTAVQWSLLLCHNILQHAYSQRGLAKSVLKLGATFLEKELAYQKTIRRSPYLEDVVTLLFRIRMEQNGVEEVKSELFKKFIPIIQKKKPLNKDKAKKVFKALSVPMEFMKTNKERADYLSTFRKVFTEPMILLKNKKTGAVSMDLLYRSLLGSEVRYLKKAGKEYRAEAVMLDKEYKKYISLSKKK